MTNTENWNDKDFVLEKVKQNGYAIYHASKERQNDIFSAISLLQLKI